jgi:hypothetical protein
MATKTRVADAPEIPEEIEKQLLSIELLPTSSLIVDDRYQRQVDKSRVTKMTQNWNWLACGSLVVSLRNGKDGKSEYAVLDGQQRLEAIKLLGFKEAPCRIYIDLNQEQEAELFELLNKAVKPGFNDLFKSRLSRKEPVANAIQNAVVNVGYHLDPERKHHGKEAKNAHFYIQTMAELERIYKLGGVTLIMDTLKFYKDVWAPEYIGQEQMFLAGTATFLKTYPSAKMGELKEKLRKEGINKLVQRTLQWAAVHGSQTGSNTRGKALCEAMLIVYNGNRQEANRIKSKHI